MCVISEKPVCNRRLRYGSGHKGCPIECCFKVMVRIYKDIINILSRLIKECSGVGKVCAGWEAPGRWSWLGEVYQGTDSAYQSERHGRLYFDDRLF